MAVGEGIRRFFINDFDTMLLIGSRFFPHEAAHGAHSPYIVCEMDEFSQPADLQGRLGKRRWVYELKCCGDSYAEARELRDTVKAAIPRLVETDLDGVTCAMHWDNDSEHDHHASAVDKPRYVLSINLVVLER